MFMDQRYGLFCMSDGTPVDAGDGALAALVAALLAPCAPLAAGAGVGPRVGDGGAAIEADRGATEAEALTTGSDEGRGSCAAPAAVACARGAGSGSTACAFATATTLAGAGPEACAGSGG